MNWKTIHFEIYALHIGLAIILCLNIVGCSDEEPSTTSKQRNNDKSNQDRKLVKSLVNNFKKLEPWPAVGTISEKGWKRYIETGQLIQRTSPEFVKQALKIFITTSFDKDFSSVHESKAFLLNSLNLVVRVLFI